MEASEAGVPGVSAAVEVAFQEGAAVSAAGAPAEAGDTMNLPFHIPTVDHKRVVAAIQAAEAKTTGEIRILVARHKAPDPLGAAEAYFNKFRMDRSALRNGVLIFVAPRSRNYAVIGDRGIHEKCGESFWTELASAMGAYFAKGEFTAGLVHGAERAGGLLARTFPRKDGDAPASPAEVSDVD